MIIRVFYFQALFFTFAGLAVAELTTIDGKPVAGDVLSVTQKDVHLSVAGKTASVKLKSLSPESQAEAINAAKTVKNWNPYPPMTIQVQVPVKRRPKEDGSWYMKTMSIDPKVVITGSSVIDRYLLRKRFSL